MNGDRHRHRRPIGQHEGRVGVEPLGDAEDVVPAAGVEPADVVAQLVEDLVHLEGGGDGLDENGGPDRAPIQAERVLGRRTSRRSTAGPRGGPPAWAGRSTGRTPGSGSPARCGTREARSRTGWPTPARRPPGSASRPGASPGDGRPAWPSRRPAGRSCPAVTSSMVPRTASCRLTWPAMTLSQVGELASSKSAMKTWAPELRALIIILRSTGPVISTRRSSERPWAPRAPSRCRCGSRAVDGRKSGRSPASKRAWRRARAASRSRRRASNRRCRSATNWAGLRGQDPVGVRVGRGVNVDDSGTARLWKRLPELVESNITHACV